MTTDEAKEYLINKAGMSNEDFERASLDDIQMGLAKKGEWVHNYYLGYPINEYEMKTAIQLAEEHKFWNDPKCVKDYEDFMIDQMMKED